MSLQDLAAFCALPYSGAWVSALSGHSSERVTVWPPFTNMTMAAAESDTLWPLCRNG